MTPMPQQSVITLKGGAAVSGNGKTVTEIGAERHRAEQPWWALSPPDAGWSPVWKKGTPPRGLVRRPSDLSESVLMTCTMPVGEEPPEFIDEVPYSVIEARRRRGE